MRLSLTPHQRARGWADFLTWHWDDGIQPNRRGVEYLRKIGIRCEQGDGRPGEIYPFVNPSFDIRLTPPPELLRELTAAAHGNQKAVKIVANVLYPCDIDQYCPYGLRGKTMIPYQLMWLKNGIALRKRGDGAPYLPDGVFVDQIPKEWSLHPNQLELL